MYSRKIKLMTGKKKSKGSGTVGSNWGPRIALAEKEKALSTTISKSSEFKYETNNEIPRRKQNSYCSSHPASTALSGRKTNGFPDHQQCQRSNYKKVSISTSSSHSQTGSSSAGNNYIYNYARKASTSGSSEGKSFFLMPPTSSTSSHKSFSNKNSFEGSTYILGSNCGSQITLSGSIAGETTTSQPLTLIIPPVVPRFKNYNGFDKDQDSFPSTRTYHSSTDDEREIDEKVRINDRKRHSTQKILQNKEFLRNSNKNPLPSKSEQVFSNPAVNLLKVSTTKSIVHHHHQEEMISNESQHESKRDNLRKDHNKNNDVSSTVISDLQSICTTKNKNNSIGSTISSLAQGFTMVYVPMESLPRSKSAAVLNASLDFDPEMSQLVKDCEMDHNSVVEEDGENFSVKEENDPDNDSLLESFDSVMFKPRDGQMQEEPHLTPGQSSSNCSSHCATPTQAPKLHSPNVTIITNVNSESTETHAPNLPVRNSNCHKTISQIKIETPKTIKNTPPPLPPKNLGMLKPKLKINDNMFSNFVKRNNCPNKPEDEPPSATQRALNIQTAVQNLENIIRPQSTITTSNISEINNERTTKSKRVTLTIPRPPESLARDVDELLHNFRNDTDTEIDAYSSTFLTCGHVLKEDDYSTLSSDHSPIMHDQDLDHLQHSLSSSGPSSSTHSPGNHRSTTHSSADGGECSPQAEKNKSVLQQLRELSILIGGGSVTENGKSRGCPNESPSAGPVTTLIAQGFRLHEEDPTRKLSDATDNSADSGKGSASASGSSPKSLNSSPDSLQINAPHSTCPNNPTSPCVFRSDCNECLMFNKPPNGFKKPNNSEEICGKAAKMNGNGKSKNHRKSSLFGPSKKSTPTKLVRRKSSRTSNKSLGSKTAKYRKKKHNHLVLEYCDCTNCCCEWMGTRNPSDETKTNDQKVLSNPTHQNEEEIVEAIGRKVSVSSSTSSSNPSVKLNRSVAFRSLSRSIRSKHSPPLPTSDVSTNNALSLFTIEEEESQSAADAKAGKEQLFISGGHGRGRSGHENYADMDVTANSPHWHPDCWLAADPMLGWSDLESLYSLNVKNDKPLSINGECWTCWQEISEIKRNSENPNGTVDRTKRMFIWLNKRHKEFQAPWWEAKKQASIRWIMTKALIHVPKEYLIDPFKESKKSKPTKYRLREEVIKGLVSGKLYSLSLANLYQETLGGKGYSAHGLNHWDIIKILSRRGVYSCLPSDMKLTQGTLRQKPIRMAAHIALIEAIMSLYAKEIVDRQRILETLYTFGCTVKPETVSPEKLVIAWINAAVMTLKSYIMSSKNHQLPPEKKNRWLQVPKVVEIRDLCDGIGICSLFAIYCSNDLKVGDISVPEPNETLTIYDSINNHTFVQKLCEEVFSETIYHLCITDFLYIHGYMKQNILCFLVDLFINLEINPVARVNRLTVPIRVDLA